MQYHNGGSAKEDICLCLESFTYTHQATSPVFAYGLGYDNTNYSTWAESELVMSYYRYTYLVFTIDTSKKNVSLASTLYVPAMKMTLLWVHSRVRGD